MHLQALYRAYSVKQRRPFLKCFIAASILYDLYCLIVPFDQELLNRGVTTIFLAANICLLFVSLRARRRFVWTTLPHLAWHAANLQILGRLFLGRDLTPRDDLGWILLIEYLIYVTLPLSLKYCLGLAIGTFATYTVCLFGLLKSDGNLESQIAANALLMIGANLLGLTSSYLEDVQQKKAFLDTKQCLEMKLVIEEQSAEQERLLLSVLPEHVAVKMRQDLGSALDTQFKKIYMSRHENVSILYADIVGFTAISSTYSASELVKILNELFARFDRLAERYEQLRIKILGDCYYCISGAPRERPDHATLSIHMGLSMVKAIKYVQQKTNSPVNMRVGIHTGAVLAGVLGQRQWQFDVYSKDVELANKMESSGLPGKVHISEKTLSFLNGEFDVEPAFGEKREESLRMAGLKTFFITKVNKPFKGDIVKNGTVHEEALDLNDEDIESVVTPVEETGAARDRENSDDFKLRLRKDLMSRTGWRSVVSHIHWFTLTFKDKQKEYSYRHNAESFSSLSLIGSPVTMFFTSLAQLIVLPRDAISIASFSVGMWALTVLVLFGIAEAYPKFFSASIIGLSRRTNHSLLGRCILAAACISILALAHVVDTVGCAIHYEPKEVNCTSQLDMSQECLYPSYFSHMTILVLIASVIPIQPLFISKILIPTGIVTLGILANLIFLWNPLQREDIVGHRHCLSYTSSLITTCITMLFTHIALLALAKVMEVGSRVLFLWKNEAEEQRERACDIRRRNEALVYNILPPHVAAHFLGNKKRQHEELYSQSYSEVGVLFASMPNFSDFYSEETVNNQGLECLRFLNEVISDFDALLEWPKFQDVIKIKTIGSTYMAASGLNPSAVVSKDDAITTRWMHLSLLVEFAFEMRKALQSINEQSFNHFVLKMGINHGPITAGVIGARKPHYDIWGNTVNVASRMESTGKAGYIQVTEETSQILGNYGYIFEQRGLVAVKGKGQLMTYYLVGKGGETGHAQSTTTQSSVAVTSPQHPDAILTPTPCSLGGPASSELPEIAEETEPSDQAALLAREQ